MDFEVASEKKYRRLFHNGSFKEQIPKRVFKHGTPNPGLNHLNLVLDLGLTLIFSGSI